MTDAKEREKFNPREHMMTMARRQRQQDGSYKTIQVEYLEVKWRIVWFREDHPHASIRTKLLSEPGAEPAVVQAEVILENGVVTTGFGQVDKQKWSDYLEKAETRAIGRALLLMGYGTQFAGDEFDDPIADAPVERQDGAGASKPPAKGKDTKKASPVPYKPVESTGDAAQDAVNIMERIEAAKSLQALKPIIENAKALKVLDDSDVSGAITLKLTDALDKVKSEDQVKAIQAVAESATVDGLGAWKDARDEAISRIAGKAGE